MPASDQMIPLLAASILLTLGCGGPVAPPDGSAADTGLDTPQSDTMPPDTGTEVGCPMGQTRCNDACVTTATDPHHCGACGNSCMASFVCRASSCVEVRCDVVYALDPPPAPNSEFHVIKTGLGAMDTASPVGTNATAAPVNMGLTTPFTPMAFPRGFLRLRFPDVDGEPAAGTVQLVEFYLPLEFATSIAGVTVTTNLDQSAGVLTLAANEVPASPTAGRACQAVAAGTLAGTTLGWAPCAVATPPASMHALGWTGAMSQCASGCAGCLTRLSTYGRVTCEGALCAVSGVDTANQRSTWDQRLTDLTFSSTTYRTATISLPEMTVPDDRPDTYVGLRIAAARPIAVECGTLAELTCDEH